MASINSPSPAEPSASIRTKMKSKISDRETQESMEIEDRGFQDTLYATSMSTKDVEATKDMPNKDDSEDSGGTLYPARKRRRRINRINSGNPDLSFRVETFEELVREMVKDINPELEIEASVIKELQRSTESFIGDLLVEASRIAAVHRRETISVEDLHMAERKWKEGLEGTSVPGPSGEMGVES
ncbi:hypothetical protein HYFRA_00002611 [Hymenoscyphus fraxineus]|uniref:Core Histone H2A/H2B/H3 domain-containing protein n=1 Tax=Hymenoscyphus fraxineus TaxID=746836 RepID=A0A9N9PNP0_9HELO|nr:hypothetical protein HYFRA_00002611 [Hymenoscyphus fraxineus]